MATAKQVTANRANAQRSTGPKTSAGKTKVSLNAIGHGLTAAIVVLPGEDPLAYHQLCEDLHAELAPQGILETRLVASIAVCLWRWERTVRIETGLHHQAQTAIEQHTELMAAHRATDPSPAPADVPLFLRAGKFATETNSAPLLSRYETALWNQFGKALRMLNELQSRRVEPAAEVCE